MSAFMQFLSQTVNQGQTPQMNNGTNQPNKDVGMRKLIQTFIKLSPPKFIGGSDPSKAEAWLSDVEKVIGTLGCDEYEKASLAIYMLQGEANLWWKTEMAKLGEVELSWGEFEHIFKEKYITKFYIRQKVTEFYNLRQAPNVTIASHECKFVELLRYVSHMHLDEEAKANLFIDSLLPSVAAKVSMFQPRTLAEAIEKAKIAEQN
eukprot:TRINITY_DN8352_c0_g1_i2.p1 TRINITY_DN8352_c0_g1~~TRINITY_DN8352_c0_g1_i2.p1  ORF type:complete len:205 (-),score=38.33 TRINITY_DN8352_c0_g1_i2:436-1050(-)